MSFKKSETITKEGGYRKFDSVEEMQSASNWFFQYKTLKEGSTTEDWAPGDLPNKNKNDYPPPLGEVTGTIFLDSSPGIIFSIIFCIFRKVRNIIRCCPKLDNRCT